MVATVNEYRNLERSIQHAYRKLTMRHSISVANSDFCDKKGIANANFGIINAASGMKSANCGTLFLDQVLVKRKATRESRWRALF